MNEQEQFTEEQIIKEFPFISEVGCTNENEEFFCTREENHTGPHVAHGRTGRPLVLWNEEGVILWEKKGYNKSLIMINDLRRDINK